MIKKKSEYRICTRCIMDTSDPNIVFDDKGRCNHCQRAINLLNKEPYCLPKKIKETKLHELAKEIKKEGENNKYDCVIGVSGGVDSSYLAFKVKELGLRPLAVHLDNGWDSELAQNNIEKIISQLKIDLYTYVIDWEEFKDIQLSFLKASTPDREIPTDYALMIISYKVAIKHKIKYFLIGSNLSTESIMPTAWSYGHSDGGYIRTLQKKFGSKKIRTMPRFNFLQTIFYYNNSLGVTKIPLLDYLDYDKDEAIKVLKKKMGWRGYGGKHYESTYTKFYQAYILPKKFGFDKRRAHLSSMICSKQISREEALKEIKKEHYPLSQLKEDKKYVIKKLGLTVKQFEAVMKLPPKSFWDYPSYNNSNYYKKLRIFIEKYALPAYRFRHKLIFYFKK